jgi:hypothetical protein
MNSLIKSLIKAEFPQLKVKIDRFKHKETGEIRWCVMQVSTPLTEHSHMFVYNASEWERIDSEPLEGVERIMECFNSDMLKRYEETLEEKGRAR